MNTARILAALDEELSRLRQVRDLLTNGQSDAPEKPRRGRPAKSATKPTPAPAPAATKKRNLSDEARQRIADAQKRRWAAQRGGA